MRRAGQRGLNGATDVLDFRELRRRWLAPSGERGDAPGADRDPQPPIDNAQSLMQRRARSSIDRLRQAGEHLQPWGRQDRLVEDILPEK